jgi:hypothetical protein
MGCFLKCYEKVDIGVANFKVLRKLFPLFHVEQLLFIDVIFFEDDRVNSLCPSETFLGTHSA